MLHCGAEEAEELAARCGLAVNVFFTNESEGAADIHPSASGESKSKSNSNSNNDGHGDGNNNGNSNRNGTGTSVSGGKRSAFLAVKEAAFVFPAGEWRACRSDIVEKKAPKTKSGFFRWEALISGRVGC